VAGLRGIVRGLIVRCGLTVLPLGMVILLCYLMMGWPGRAQSQDRILTAPSALSAQAATVNSHTEAALSHANMHPLPPQPEHNTSLAAFERLHITHSRVHVPD
jgi:hypothetical protein